MAKKKKLLNLPDLPEDPIRRIIWLAGVRGQVDAELDDLFSEAYYEARLEQRLPDAVKAGPHSMKKALALTRARNQANGRTVRWGDQLDPTSR